MMSVKLLHSAGWYAQTICMSAENGLWGLPMRIKANNLQRGLMLGLMTGVALWSAWPDWRLVGLVVISAIAFGLYLFTPRRRDAG
jgi:hypothetical protein